MGKVELWHKRHALNLVAQLPETTEDALQILDLARKLVEEFLAAPASKPSLCVMKPPIRLAAKAAAVPAFEPITSEAGRAVE